VDAPIGSTVRNDTYFGDQLRTTLTTLLGKGVDNKNQEASIAGAVAAAHYIRSVAPVYGVPVVLHTDHCAKKLLPWLDGMLDADEAYFKEHGEPLFSSHMIDLSEEDKESNIATTASKHSSAQKSRTQLI
jgi:fructose/tagatose bisphosphate aldolase